MRWTLLACLVFASCGALKTDVLDVKEITWEYSSIQNSGKAQRHLITFRSDGTAESMDADLKAAGHPGPEDIVERSRAAVTPEQLRQLAEKLAAHGFFTTKETYRGYDATETITVTTSRGKTELPVLFRNGDPDKEAMVQAVNDLAKEIKWEKLPVANK